MKSAIVYSLFGYERKTPDNCFSFDSYLRGLMVCIRMNRLLYPGWKVILETDKSTHTAWGKLFDNIPIEVEINPDNTPLTLAMLWRLKPVFHTLNGTWKYDYVLCRDLDSPATYREVQAVTEWMNHDKAAHAITDSVSHNLPMLGGMIGFRPKHITSLTGINAFEHLPFDGYQWEVKGTDQHFLNQFIYPQLAKHGSDSITQHYFNGMPNTFLSDFHTCTCPPPAGHNKDCPNNISISLPEELKESNNVCGHIGASGWYETALWRFLKKYQSEFQDLSKIEKEFPNIFYWNV